MNMLAVFLPFHVFANYSRLVRPSERSNPRVKNYWINLIIPSNEIQLSFLINYKMPPISVREMRILLQISSLRVKEFCC